MFDDLAGVGREVFIAGDLSCVLRLVAPREEIRRQNMIGKSTVLTSASDGSLITFPTLRSANRARQKEWDKNDDISLEYRCNELAGEMGEACNVIKKLERERLGIRGSRATRAHLAEELADVVICVDLIAMGKGALVPLNTGHPVGFGTAAHAGTELAKQVGWLCGCVLGQEFEVLETRCLLVVRVAYALAAIYEIDLDSAVVAKFNATSEKVGLSTRLMGVAACSSVRLRHLEAHLLLGLFQSTDAKTEDRAEPGDDDDVARADHCAPRRSR